MSPVPGTPDDADPEPDPEDEELLPTETEVALEVEAEVEERRYPSTIGGAFYLGILAVAAAGIVVAWSGDWRLGVRLLAGSLCTGSLLRLMLPARDAGMLAVRHRLIDCLVLGGLGIALFFLTATIPDRPV